jgi:nicotinamidase-related amidase
MNPARTAVIFIGFQHDYFAPDGILNAALEDKDGRDRTLKNALTLVKRLAPTKASLISTPILFTPDYSELNDPVGILKAIKESGAFRRDRVGGECIPEFRAHEGRMDVVPGKRGLNAFSNTHLEILLRERQIEDVVVVGAITSLCIDSTARQAMELGFRTTILSDATCGRTKFEQDFYCTNVFPLYANLKTTEELLAALGA